MEVADHLASQESATINRAGPVRELPAAGLDPGTIAGLTVTTERWGATTVAEVLARTDARSLVVLHRGQLAYEWYRPDTGPDRRNRCYSITKSFTGTLAALAVPAGTLDRNALVGDLLPELADSGFGTATVGQIADMTAAIGYDEDYADADDTTDGTTILGFGDYMVTLGLDRPGIDLGPDVPRSIRTFLPTVGPGTEPHGRTFTYATPTADVLGWLVETTHPDGYVALLTEALWARLGAEHDAVLSLDPVGTPMAGGGLGMTTRDLARFGLLLTEADPATDPDLAAAVATVRAGGDEAAFARGHYDYLAGYSYRDQWWMPGGPTRPLSAWGIHGQVLWVDPDAEIVVASHCASPDASDERRDLEQDALCRAVTRHLAPD